MKCEWKRCTIGDLGRIITGKTPNTKVTEYWDGNIPFVTPKDLQGTKHIDCTERSITSNGLDTVKGSTLPANSVCVSCIGNIGYTGITTQICVTNQQINTIVVNKFNNFDFVYYLLRNLWSYFKNYEGQSTTLSILNKTQFSKIGITIPDLEAQKKIAKVLSALDDKIELNNQINKNLEEQAKSVFDCIYTKAPATYIGNLIETIECGSRPRGGAEKTGIPSIGAEKIERFGVYDFANEKFISEEYYERMTRGKIISGDVLLYKDGAYTGKVSMALDSYPYIKCAVNEHVFIVRTTASMYQSYLYFCLSRQDVRKQVHTLASSKAAQPGLNQNELKSVSICVPDKITLNNFEIQVAPLMHTIAINALQNKRLSEIRDTLLPKLMSGEIDVDNVEI